MALIEITILLVLLTWIAYIPAANIVNRHKEKKYTGISKYLAYLYLALFLVIDATCNIIAFTILYMELPQEWLVTTRMKRHLHGNQTAGFRFRASLFICKYMIEPWDVGHCALQRVTNK